MSVAVNNLVDRVELLLQDTSNVRWGASELIYWLNDGQREVVLIKPDVSVTNESVLLVAGTKQTIPTDGIQLSDLVRNMGTDGTTVGKTISLIERRVLDTLLPTWHSDIASTVVKHFMFDTRDPRHYYVYPKSPGTNYVEIVYTSPPATVAAGGNISIPDIYSNCLIDYMLYRAYAKDADFVGNSERALAHYSAFQRSLGIRTEAEGSNEPNSLRRG